MGGGGINKNIEDLENYVNLRALIENDRPLHCKTVEYTFSQTHREFPPILPKFWAIKNLINVKNFKSYRLYAMTTVK